MNLYAFTENQTLGSLDILGLKKLTLRYRTCCDLATLNDEINTRFATAVLNLDDVVADVKRRIGSSFDPEGKCGNCIATLVVTAHSGLPGYVSFSPTNAPEDSRKDSNYKGQFSSEEAAAAWADLSQYFCTDGRVYVQQCEAGAGDDGTDTLKCLAQSSGVPVCAPCVVTRIGRTPKCYKIVYPDGSVFEWCDCDGGITVKKPPKNQPWVPQAK